MRIGAAIVLVLLVGCGSKSSAPPEAKREDRKPSEVNPESSVTNKSEASSGPDDSCKSAGESAAGYAREDRREELGQIVEKRCREDQWREEVRTCMRKAGTPIHQIACVRQLPKDAQGKLNGELKHLGAPFEVGGAP